LSCMDKDKWKRMRAQTSPIHGGTRTSISNAKKEGERPTVDAFLCMGKERDSSSGSAKRKATPGCSHSEGKASVAWGGGPAGQARTASARFIGKTVLRLVWKGYGRRKKRTTQHAYSSGSKRGEKADRRIISRSSGCKERGEKCREPRIS